MANDPTVVFLDANVLAKPLTRTLLIVGATDTPLEVVWSAYVETEAERHLPEHAMPLLALRQRHQFELSPTGDDAERFTTTSATDRQVLADTFAAGARFLVTEDVDDIAEEDLATLRMTAIHPDLFMALRFPRSAYLLAVNLMVAAMKNPPRTAAQMHALLGRKHPRLTAAHAEAFDGQPDAPTDPEPRVLVRGVRCVRCESVVETWTELRFGLCVDCQH